MVPDHEKGAGFGSLQLILGIAALPSSLMMGFIMTRFGSSTAFTISGLIAVIASGLLVIWSRLRANIPKQETKTP